MAQILSIRANYDLETSYSSAYCEPILHSAVSQGHRVVGVTGPKVLPLEVLSRLKKLSPRLFVFSGHGTKATFEGHKGIVILEESNCEALKGTIVYCRAFWGVQTDGYASRPLQDPQAMPVYENSNIVPLQLVKGVAVKDAIREAHRDAARRILRVLDLPDPLASATLVALTSNDSSLGFCGDGAAHV